MNNVLVASLVLCAAAQAQRAIGVFDAHGDVGQVRHAGTVAYDRQRQEYVIAGSGQNMWGERDDFHFVWKRLSGDFTLSTRARFIGTGVEAHRKIGWTIRPSLASNGAHVTAALHGDGLMSLQFRRAAGGITEEQPSRDRFPEGAAVIRLERRNGAYVMSVGRAGATTLATQELAGVSLPDTVYVGLFVCAHNDTVVERAVFSDVRITRPDELLSYFDSISAIHRAHPDTGLVRRLHPGADTLLSIEDTVFEQFTGDSLLRRVHTMHADVREMHQRFTERRVLRLDDRYAIIAAREAVDWIDRGGAHRWQGVLTVVLEKRARGWVIRAYHGAASTAQQR